MGKGRRKKGRTGGYVVIVVIRKRGFSGGVSGITYFTYFVYMYICMYVCRHCYIHTVH